MKIDVCDVCDKIGTYQQMNKIYFCRDCEKVMYMMMDRNWWKFWLKKDVWKEKIAKCQNCKRTESVFYCSYQRVCSPNCQSVLQKRYLP